MEKREGYKKTKIGWIPEDWGLEKLKGFSSVITKGTTPTTLGFAYQGSGINFVKVESIDNFGQFIPQLFAHISEDANSALKRSILREKDLLFSIAGALGRVAIVNKTILPANTNQALAIIRLNKDENIISNYLVVYLRSEIIKDHIKKISVQSAQSNVSLTDVNNFPVLLPPLPEQKKIASILTTVDDKISSIEHQIQQTEQLKKGLMEKLLTEGIGHTEFKETKVGRMPKGWDVVNINTISERKSGHTPNRKIPEYWNGGIKWVSLADTFRLDRRYLSETEYNISEAGIKNSSAVKLKKGAVIISRDAGIGKSTIINNEMAVSQHFIAWECGETLFNLFLFYLLQKWKPQFERIANGTTIKTIGLDFFRKMEIPVPALSEQKQIATILSTVDDKIEVLTQKKTQYQTLKKGLSQQLLTGQMRVKI